MGSEMCIRDRFWSTPASFAALRRACHSFAVTAVRSLDTEAMPLVAPEKLIVVVTTPWLTSPTSAVQPRWISARPPERRALDLNTLVSISSTRLLDEIRARRASGVVRGLS